jgi:UDP-2,4-diacetamido-2,4,6-trideoxy-beta-L-altropyranose hydrolase
MHEQVTVRKATPRDIAAVFELSNQPSVRDSSFNSAPIDWKDHTGWYSAATTDPNCGFYIAEIAEALAGQLRFKRKGDEAIVSISIDPRFRGKGIGAVLYRQGLSDFRLRHPVRKIIAMVKRQNGQSIAFFRHLGFVDSTCERINGEEAVIMVDHLQAREVKP